MKKFHLNPATGVASECKAQKNNCRFGATDEEHYSSKAEAQQAFENSMSTTNTMSLKKKKVKPVKVYRAGDLTPPESYFEDLEQTLSQIDKFVPEGRQARRGGIFASPDIKSHGRWLRGVNNKTSHELLVDPDSVYVYSVEAYENASARDYASDAEDRIKAFWATGMTLTQWKVWADEHKPERGSWEIIMPETAIISAKPVSNKFIIENVNDNDAYDLNWTLEQSRAQRGLIWRKNKLSDDDLAIVAEDLSKTVDDKELIKDIETIYKLKGYKEDDVYSSKDSIFKAVNKLRAARNSELVKDKTEESNIIDVFTAYTKLADILRDKA